MENIENIHSSKDRMNALTNIGADVRILNVISIGDIKVSRPGRNYEADKRSYLNE